ncbi:hypothetical protein ACHAPT_009480 [Fusarium lateritium]
MAYLYPLQAAILWAVALVSVVAAAEFPWAAIGDSFSAGPGAGDRYHDSGGDCYRTIGSYPAQLEDDFPVPDGKLQFRSCTGAKVPGMIANQIPNIDPYQKVVTVSIGGNDLGFGRVLRACIFKPGGGFSDDCDKTLEFVRERLTSGFIRQKLKEGYEALTDRLTGDHRRIVLVQLYPNFFNEGTDWCDDQSMGIVPGYKPKLTKELRQKLNALGDELRQTIINAVRDHDGYAPSNEFWYYVDENDQNVYPRHRFCEDGFTSFDDPNIWFFTPRGSDTTAMTTQDVMNQYDPSTCKDDPRYEDDGDVFPWYCDMARYLAMQETGSTNVPDEAGNLTIYTGEGFIKAFHPKTRGFTHVAKGNWDYIRYRWSASGNDIDPSDPNGSPVDPTSLGAGPVDPTSLGAGPVDPTGFAAGLLEPSGFVTSLLKPSNLTGSSE